MEGAKLCGQSHIMIYQSLQCYCPMSIKVIHILVFENYDGSVSRVSELWKEGEHTSSCNFHAYKDYSISHAFHMHGEGSFSNGGAVI